MRNVFHKVTWSFVERAASLAVIAASLVFIWDVSSSHSALNASRRGGPEKPTTAELDLDTLTKHGATIGSQNAKVLLVEFSDFQCPFCSREIPATRLR